MKKASLISAVLLLSVLANAHEFWLQPLKFIYEVNELLKVSFRVGDQFIGKPWDLSKHRVERLELHHKQKVDDLRDQVSAERHNLTFTLEDEGTQLLAMSSNNAYSELGADEFNAYLQEEALDEAKAHRRKTESLGQPGKELYMRNAKLLIQVGHKRDSLFQKRVGLPLEIIPEQNPYALKIGDRISFRILFQGKPLFGARVRVFNKHENRTVVQNIYTQQNGKIETHISNKGSWMVSVVKMVPSEDSQADWQSYWGSLVFGIK